jgi:hypothetical protein
MVLRHDSRKARRVEPEETAVARERPINIFPRQRIHVAKMFSIGSTPVYENVREVPSWVGCGRHQPAKIGAAEHRSRGNYIIGNRYQAITSEKWKT